MHTRREGQARVIIQAENGTESEEQKVDKGFNRIIGLLAKEFNRIQDIFKGQSGTG